MEAYEKYTTPSKVNAQIDARLYGQKDEDGGLAANNTTIINLDTVSDFSALSRKGRTSFYVKDVETGGLFTYKPSSDALTPDGENIFELPGGGYAVRNYQGTINRVLPAFDLSNVRVMTSIAPDTKIIKSNVLDSITGEYVTFKEYDGVSTVDGVFIISHDGKKFKRVGRTLHAKSFGVKGDGSFNDTLLLQAAFDAVEDGMDFVLDEGIYCVTTVTIQNKNKVNFYFNGTIKALDGSDVTSVVRLLNNFDCNYYNLEIDGNRENVVDKGAAGSQPNLLIGSSQKRLGFYNLKLVNSVYPGAVFNGLCEDIYFENTYCENIGEHCFYISGGGNKKITFKNLKALNINQLAISGHESYVFKIRNIASGTNEDFDFENIELEQSNIHEDSAGEFMFGFLGVKGVSARRLKYIVGESGKRCISIFTGKGEDIHFEDVEADSLIWSVTGGPVKNITLKRGEFSNNGYFSFGNYLDLCEDVTINGRMVFNSFSTYKTGNFKTIFRNTKFIITVLDERHTLNFIERDVDFENCNFNGYSASAIANNLIDIGANGYVAGTFVRFIETKIDATGWNNSIAVRSPVSIEVIQGSNINKSMRSYSATIPLVRVVSSVLPDTEFISSAYYSNLIIEDNSKSTGDPLYRKSGTTASRPSTPPFIGFDYFNTDLGIKQTWNGTLWVSARSAASADVASAVGATYVQAEVQAILTELRDLKTKMRTAGLLAT